MYSLNGISNRHLAHCVLPKPECYLFDLSFLRHHGARQLSLLSACPSRHFPVILVQRSSQSKYVQSSPAGWKPARRYTGHQKYHQGPTVKPGNGTRLKLQDRGELLEDVLDEFSTSSANANFSHRTHAQLFPANTSNHSKTVDKDYHKIAAPTDSAVSHANDEDLGECAGTPDFASGFSQVLSGHNTYSDKRQPPIFVNHAATRSKVDLSYYDVRSRELETLRCGRIVTRPVVPSTFRSNTGMRRILYEFMQYLEPILSEVGQSDERDKKLAHRLAKVFSKEAIQLIQAQGYTVQDVATWSWMLNSSNTALSIKRYIVICRQSRKQELRPLPLFLPLQMLRSPFIDDTSLKLLITELETDFNKHNRWGKESGAILLVRLLRHARLTNASLHERVAELAPKVLPLEIRGDSHADMQRLTHFYNRFLSLLALPTARHPFRSVDNQQRAQLRVARFMTDASQQIPLNREGYRALARLQLMHKKTTEEQHWSGVKAPSWPPWRRDELGIDARIEYPGRQSRVAKVIKRLLESGYGPESVEHEAKILAGWDIDKSPTIQVRRVARKRPLAWIRSVFKSQPLQETVHDFHVWAARVAATRSVREAWVCFYAYMNATMHHERHLTVYHEMFHKLFARVQQTDQKSVPSPGDGKEVFDDPTSLRDLAYVPKEPPSIEELYAQMLQDGIRPAGRLLASLIDSARTLKQGLDYLDDSALDEVKKDVLLHPEKYPQYFISRVFTTLPDYLLASYIALLCKRSTSHEIQLYWPGSRSAEEKVFLPQDPVRSLQYSLALMRIWRPKYMPAFHAILEGICTQAKTRRNVDKGPISRQFAYSELWRVARYVLNMLDDAKLCPDLVCFRKVIVLLRNGIVRAPGQFTSNSEVVCDALINIKTIFAKAVGGSFDANRLRLPNSMTEIGHQPYWKDVEALILVLGYGRDYSAIIDVLRWLDQEQEQLECIEEGSYKMLRIMCSVHAALNASWMRDASSSASEEQIEDAKMYTRQWTWPEDVDLEEYKNYHAVWFNGMRAGMR